MHSTKFLMSCVVIFSIILHLTDSRYISGEDYKNDKQHQQQLKGEPKKRPFCNAFTGCGRKRSDTRQDHSVHSDYEIAVPLQQLEQQSITSDDTIGSLLDLNAEPAIEDVMRQIMSESKLWEAIQEANRDLSESKNFNKGYNGNNMNYPIAFSTQ